MTEKIIDGYREKFSILADILGGVRRIFRKLAENRRNESQYTVLSRILDKYAIVQELCYIFIIYFYVYYIYQIITQFTYF